MSRRSKQFIYGFFYILILSGILLAIYFSSFKPSPSCFDGKLNQGEEGIDCGGPCNQVCFPEDFSEIDIVKTRIFKINSSRLSLFAEIKNPNSNLVLQSFSYTFNLFDAKDKSLGSFSGESRIYAKESAYLLVPNVSVTSSLAERIELEIDSLKWLKSENLPKPKLTVNNIETLFAEDGVRVTGTLVNQDAAEFSKVRLIAVLFGRFNQPVGASVTELNRLSSNETRSFEILHPLVSDLNVGVTRVQVLPNLP